MSSKNLTLADYCYVNPSKWLPEGIAYRDLVSFIPMSDVTENGHWNIQQVRKLIEVENGFTSFKNKDVLVAKITPCFENGKGALVDDLIGDVGFGSTEFHVLRAKSGTDPRFIFHISQWKQFRVSALKFMSGSAGQQRVSSEFFYKFKVEYFSKAEQESISDILDFLDSQIRETEVIIAKLQQVKQGLLHDLLTRGIDGNSKLRPSYEDAPELYKPSELGWIPKGWKVGTIESFLEKIIDYRGKTPTKVDLGIRLITAKNVRKGFIQEDPKEFIAEHDYDLWMTRGIPEEKDILFTTEAPLGMVAQIGTTEKLAFAQRLIILQAKRNIDSSFLKQRLLSEQFQKGVLKKATGSTALGIKQSEFRKVVTCFPNTKEEQEAISERVETLEENILNFKVELEKLKLKKYGLMDDLLTGKKRVTDLINQQQAS